MSGRIRKGMVLAAGLGTRLKPVTLHMPKPLVPVLNIPNILYTLLLLKRAGISEIILNLHHLPESLENFLGDGGKWDLKLQYSRENVLLGTGGGVKKAEKFFEGETFVLANCDFITDIDLRPFIERHLSRNALATMILHEDSEKQRHYSQVGVTKEGTLCSLPSLQTREPARGGIFTGLHVLSAETLSYLRPEPCGINDLLYPALMRNKPDRAFGDFTQGSFWLDTGEPWEMWTASMKLLDTLQERGSAIQKWLSDIADYEEKRAGVWMPREAMAPDIEVIAPAVIGKGCHFGKQSIVGPYTVLGDNSQVGDGVRVSRFLALGAPRIVSKPGSETIEGAMQFQETILPLKKRG